MAIAIIWILFSIGAAICASNKNRSVFIWFILGVFLGPFALIFVILLSPVPVVSAGPGRFDFLGHFFNPPRPPAIERHYCPECGWHLSNNVPMRNRTILNWCPRCKKEIL